MSQADPARRPHREPTARAGRWVALAVLAVGGLGACNDDGRTLAPAPSTTAGVPETTSTSGAEVGVSMQLASPDVVDGDRLDPRVTCDGEGVAPTLVFSGVPTTAAALAVAVVDLDAGGYVHWALAGLSPATAQMGPEVPPGAVAARSSGGVDGWEAPCPPAGDEAHRYELRLYATGEPIGLAPGLDGREAIEIIERAAVDVARVTVRYGRAG